MSSSGELKKNTNVVNSDSNALKHELSTDKECKKEIDYKKSEEYWASQPATVNGMLGGFDFVSKADIEHSQKFLDFFLTVSI